MNSKNLSNKNFSIIKRVESFTHATRGIWIFLKSTPNAWLHLAILFITICLGVYFHITSVEWMFLVLSSGLVLASEAFNTAIEIDINLTSPNYHPYAKDTKDVAAGAVLISSVTALIIGIFIFGHYIL